MENKLPSADFENFQADARFKWVDLGYNFRSFVSPISKVNNSVNVKLWNRNFSISVSQVPLSVSVAATVCKIQGHSLKVIFIPSTRRKGRNKGFSLRFVVSNKIISFWSISSREY